MFNDIVHEQMQQAAEAKQRDTVIGKNSKALLMSDGLQVDGYSTVTLQEGNSNIEQVVGITRGDSLGIVKKSGFFYATYGTDGSITHGTSMFSFGSTSDGRYIFDMSIPTGGGSHVGATCYYNPNVVTNYVKYAGNVVGSSLANPPKIFVAPNMPFPAFP